MPLKRQDRVVVTQEGLVADEQLGEPPRGRADCPAVVLLQEEAPVAAVASKEPAAGRGQLRFSDAQLCGLKSACSLDTARFLWAEVFSTRPFPGDKKRTSGVSISTNSAPNNMQIV